jgi:molybdopterin/thiamine biosynthesis adenylyltransferase
MKPFLEAADLFISCANRLDARLHLERQAVRLRKPCIQACVQDGRAAHAGVVSVWTPNTDSSCFGCLFSDNGQRFRRGEILQPTVTRTVASFAAHIAVEMLTGNSSAFLGHRNVFVLNLHRCALEALSVKRRLNCTICGERHARHP